MIQTTFEHCTIFISWESAGYKPDFTPLHAILPTNTFTQRAIFLGLNELSSLSVYTGRIS